jgi:hypothetical protein
MAVLRASDGKFYDVPDADAKKYEVAPDKVKETLAKLGPGPEPGPHSGGPIGAPGRGGPVVIQIFPGGGQGPGASAGPSGDGGVDPYWYYYYWWRNFY